MKKSPKKVIYYRDLLNDDFANTNIKANPIDDNYRYLHRNFFWRLGAFICYRLFAVPLVWFYTVVIMRVKFKYADKRAVKKVRKQVFLYGNHTSYLDAFVPGIITAPTANKILVSPDTVSIKGIRTLVQMLGAFPVPSTPHAMKNFLTAMQYYHDQGNAFTVYPEAHIWPYYTGIRPYPDTSFAYPVKFEAPVVAFVTTFARSKSPFHKVARTVYVSQPFYADQTLPAKEARQELRNRVYDWMQAIAKEHSTYAYIEYRPQV